MSLFWCNNWCSQVLERKDAWTWLSTPFSSGHGDNMVTERPQNLALELSEWMRGALEQLIDETFSRKGNSRGEVGEQCGMPWFSNTVCLSWGLGLHRTPMPLSQSHGATQCNSLDLGSQCPWCPTGSRERTSVKWSSTHSSVKLAFGEDYEEFAYGSAWSRKIV